MSGGTIGFQGFGRTRRLEFPDGTNAPVSEAGRAALRYNPGSMAIEVSTDGAAYVALSTGGGGASPWVDDGAGNVRLQNVSNDVVIGAAAVAGTERMRVIGDVRVESQVQVTELTSVPGAGLDLEISSDTGNVTLTAPGVGGFGVDVGFDAFRATSTSTELQTATGEASALNVNDGTNDYLNVDTTLAAETITIGNTTNNPAITAEGDDIRFQVTNSLAVADALQGFFNVDVSVGTVSTGEAANPVRIEQYGDMVMQVPDNDGRPWVVQDAVGNDYIVGRTTNGSEGLDIGNTVTNPAVTFLGSGDVAIDDAPLCLGELAADPGATADTVKVYGKEVAGVTELFVQDDAGNVVQITSGGSVVGGTSIPIADNDATAFRVFESVAGDDYIVVDTTDGSEQVLFGSAAIDPDYVFQGTGTVRLQELDRAGFINIGATQCTSLRLGRTGFGTTVQGQLSVQGFTTQANHTAFVEQGADPAATLSQGKVYTKDAVGLTELFYIDSAGTVTQITSNGGVPAGAGGANTEVQFNNAGALDGDASFSFDGTNVTTTNALFADGGLDRSAAAALGLAQDNATSVSIGRALNPVTAALTIPDNTATAWSIVDANGDAYMNVTTTNAGEFVGFGNNNTAPDYFFLGSGSAAGVGTDASGRVEAASFGPGPLFGFSRAMFVGTQVQATSITIGQSAAALTIDSSDIIVSDAQLSLVEIAADPGGVVNTGRLYTKDVAAATELFYQDAAGNVVQITSGGGVVGGTSIPIADNDATAFRVFESVGGDNYILINTTNGAEAIGLGNATTVPDVNVLGSGAVMTVGASGDGQLTVTDIEPGTATLNIAPSGTPTVNIGTLTAAVNAPGGLNLGTESGATAGEVRASGNVEIGGNFDKASASTIGLGTAVATSVFLGRSTMLTRVFGNLTCDETLTSSGPFVHLGSVAAETFDVNLPDNTASCFRVRQSSRDFLSVDTTNLAEVLYLGPAAGLSETFVRLRGGTAGGTLDMEERTTDPGGVANRGRLYAKDVSGTTLLFYQDSAGAVSQLTSAEAASPTQIPIENNTTNAFTIFDNAAASDYLDINTTTGAEEITIGGAANPVITVETTSDIAIGSTGASIAFLGASAQPRTAAYTPTNVVTTRAYDANATDIDELADVVGTMIADLQGFGLFG